MRTYSATSDAPPQDVWRLLAEPGRWHEWAPHVRGARGLGSPEVEVGRSGSVRLAGVVPIPVRIVAKESGRSWSWQVGPVRMDHRVEPVGEGSLVAVDVQAPVAVEALLRVTYGPLLGLLMKNLARVAGNPR